MMQLASVYGVSVDDLLGRKLEHTELSDPELGLFFRGEWTAFTEEEKTFVRGMIRESRELLRKRRQTGDE